MPQIFTLHLARAAIGDGSLTSRVSLAILAKD
jgi:hypothetical protein